VSFRRLLDRTVTIVPRVVTGQDARGNDIVVDGTHQEGVRAGRDQLSAEEDLVGRDQQETTWVYFLPPEVTISGYDRILDDGEILEVRGHPDRVVRRRGGRLHHIEAVAYRIQG